MTKTSPRQIMQIIEKIDKALWTEYKTYEVVFAYIKRWHEPVWDAYRTGWNGYDGVNFEIIYKDEKKTQINLIKTLNNMEDELLFKIAVDTGVKIPNIIYAVPEIISLTANDYKDVYFILENAYKKVYEDPSHAIALSNSALETIIKRILNDINLPYNKKDTLYNLTQTILKEFKMYPIDNSDISRIGSGLLNATKYIEILRSNHTKEAHGKLENDYIIDDPLYSQFIINSISTIGLFLLNFYEKNYKTKTLENKNDLEIPF